MSHPLKARFGSKDIRHTIDEARSSARKEDPISMANVTLVAAAVGPYELSSLPKRSKAHLALVRHDHSMVHYNLRLAKSSQR